MRMLVVTVAVVCGYMAYGSYVKALLHDEGMRLGDVAIGGEVPDFTLSGLNGESVRLDEAAGEHDLVLVNFWATWCGPCRMEKPMLERMQEKYGEDGLMILAVNLGEDEARVREFVEETGLTLRVVMDPEGEVADLLGVRGLPTTIIVDRNRRLKHTSVGLDPSMEWTLEWMMASD